MNIEKDKEYLLVRINSADGNQFYSNHLDLIQKYGHVWFCRFGKTSALVQRINGCAKQIFLRESIKNGGTLYIATVSDVRKEMSEDNMAYPIYYKEIKEKPSLWFKITELKKLHNDDILTHFHTIQNRTVNDALKSMCPLFYIVGNENIVYEL